MSTGKQKILKKLAEAVIVGNTEMVKELADEVLTSGVEAEEAIKDGLAKGMRVVGGKYKAKEYFPPNVLLSAEAMHAGLKILLPHTPVSEIKDEGKKILGLMEGYVHDVGKNGVEAKLTSCQYCQTVGEVKMLVDNLMAAIEMIQKEKETGVAIP